MYIERLWWFSAIIETAKEHQTVQLIVFTIHLRR
jgi:hypothetical protein